MVLTKTELLTSLQNEVRILLHLASKIDAGVIDYRPTPKQRSTLDLLRYLSVMGPALVEGTRKGFDQAAWAAVIKEAEARDLSQTLEVIASHHDTYARLLDDMSETDLRGTITGFDGKEISRGAFIVNMVLCGCAAYRTQLFLYLKACGREELNTLNLWMGIDAPMAAV